MNLKELKPGLRLSNPNHDLPGLLGYLLTQVQFVPNISHILGWRGVVPSQRYAHTWTMRTGGRPGIFGVYLDLVETNDAGCAQATYRVTYFPNPDERLFRHFSSVARTYASQPSYLEAIREFAADLDMAALFEVGRFTLAADSNCDTLVFGLNGLSRRQITTDHTASLIGERGVHVESGSLDEHLPAFALAYELFKVLASSVAFAVGEAPCRLNRNSYPGWRYSVNTAGQWEEHPDASHHYNDIRLTFGCDTDAVRAFGVIAGSSGHCVESWRSPDNVPARFAGALWWHAHDLEQLSVIDKRSLGIEDRPQLLVLSGFLGSGKTSFLRNFIEYQSQHHRFVAVIQNEVGEVSVDASLLDDAYAVTELNDGTVCCTLVGELRPSLQRILNNFHPDVIVIETSGIANPLGLQADMRTLEDLVRFDSVTTVVDAEQFERSIKEFDVAADQVRAADVIVLNKTDLASKEQLLTLEETLRTLNAHAAITRARHGGVNPGLLYDFDLAASRSVDDQSVHGQEFVHTHDALTSRKIDYSDSIPAPCLLAALENVPPNVFRIKGVVDLVDRGPTLVQFVGGRFNLTEFQNPNVDDRFLILIGHDLGPAFDTFRILNDKHDPVNAEKGIAVDVLWTATTDSVHRARKAVA